MLNNFSLRTKLFSSFALVLALLLLVGGMGFYALMEVKRYSGAETQQLLIQSKADAFETDVYRMLYFTNAALFRKDVRERAAGVPTYREYMIDRMESMANEARGLVTDMVEALDPVTQRDYRNLANDMYPLLETYVQLGEEWTALQDGILDSAVRRVQLANTAQDNIQQIIDRIMGLARSEARPFTVMRDGAEATLDHAELLWVVQQQELGSMLERIEYARRVTREQIAITDLETLRRSNERIATVFAAAAAELDRLHAGFISTPANRDNAEAAQRAFAAWIDEMDNVSRDMIRQLDIVREMETLAQKALTSSKRIVDEAERGAKEAETALNNTIVFGEMIIVIVSLIAILLGIVLGLILTSNIATTTSRITDLLNHVVHDGDIAIQIDSALLARGDEVGVLAKAAKDVIADYVGISSLAQSLADGNWTVSTKIKSDKDEMNRNLGKMIELVSATLGEINRDVQQVAVSSGEVSTAAQNLSNGAQTSAASLEEITASMSEIRSQTKINAESAVKARDLAKHASNSATDGQKAMQEMVGAMNRITQNSEEIQRVIKVIDDIAFQTNLLALNAAVEAARAGVHGKGFAVVAEEVRNLAARSAKAAKETSELISKSGHEIDSGGMVATRTAEVLNSIVEQVQQTTELVGGIATASNEQAEGVNQITIGLQQIDAVTQQNTASAEESASAAGEMSAMAKRLQELVAKFRLRR